MCIPRQRHLTAQRIQVERFSLLQEEGMRSEVFPRRETVECGCDRNDQYIAGPAHDLVESGQALRDQVMVG